MSKQIKEKDLIVIGAGPAGLTAGIYAARAGLDTLILEKDVIGGQVRLSYTIENYPGFEKSWAVNLLKKWNSRQLHWELKSMSLI